MNAKFGERKMRSAEKPFAFTLLERKAIFYGLNRATQKTASDLKQQGMNAKPNSLCKRSSNLIIQLCVNRMQFCDPAKLFALRAFN